uniref:Uncharacterized protein n=1 Tax=Oryza brachyantha TaxID=4533 RepID=J3M6H0_ORYBR
MACRTLELTLLSASDLRVVNLVSKMEVYAVVYLAGDPRARQRVGSSKTTHGVLNLSYKLGGVVHPDPAASCSCKAIAKAAGDTTTAYLAAAYMAAPPPLYGYPQPPAIPQPGRPMGAMAAPDKNGVLHCP